MKKSVIACSLIAGILGVGGSIALANYRWRARTARLIERLNGGSSTVLSQIFHNSDLEGLPPPVARYLGTVLREGQPVFHRARIRQEGQFLLNATADAWRPFTATQHVSMGKPGFVWDARIALSPGVAILVRDALVEGTGAMQASLLGLLPLTSVQGCPEIASGALHRYLAEAVWYPTALLPSAGVVWTALSDTQALATLTNDGVTVSLIFCFGQDGLVESVFTPERMREENNHFVPTPWQGRFLNYDVCDGTLIPRYGEVEWILPEGPQVYWKGHMMNVSYEPAAR